MSQCNNTPDNNPLFTWSIEDTDRLSKLISEFTTEKSGYSKSLLKIYCQNLLREKKFKYRRFVQNKCKKTGTTTECIKLQKGRHWEDDEENLLTNILEEMGEMGKKSSEINWNSIYERFIKRRGRSDRDKKALQERIRANYQTLLVNLQPKIPEYSKYPLKIYGRKLTRKKICRRKLARKKILNIEDLYRTIKFIISRHWDENEENLLKNILEETGEMGKKSSEINWNSIYEQFIEKRGRSDRDKKALQERNYIDPKVRLPEKQKKFTFTENQTLSIIDYKVNNETIGWKEIADNLNEVIDLQNELNKASGKKIRPLPRCTPNQVKNKYNTVIKTMKGPLDTLAKTAELRRTKEIKETEKINKMEGIEEIKETEEINKMEGIEEIKEEIDKMNVKYIIT
ncbi:5042_t:CDS:10 [Diversispora eburnea]|uniref:5042_t:CDS:1 n=1 Tax=Diversispora eburnea TaxID=1213867 RepID=A0A9N8WE58_9GLOM|nr:5042_t:CDS:10 [Diversispora eburnea]